MPHREITVICQGVPRKYRVELVRSSFLIGAHFFDLESNSVQPAAFTSATAEQETFAAYSGMTDDDLAETCTRVFSSPDFVEQVFRNEVPIISLGHRLP